MAALNNAIPFALIAYGETAIASGLASILNATTPLFTVLVAHALTDDEKLTPLRVSRHRRLASSASWCWWGRTCCPAASTANLLAETGVPARRRSPTPSPASTGGGSAASPR